MKTEPQLGLGKDTPSGDGAQGVMVALMEHPAGLYSWFAFWIRRIRDTHLGVWIELWRRTALVPDTSLHPCVLIGLLRCDYDPLLSKELHALQHRLVGWLEAVEL